MTHTLVRQDSQFELLSLVGHVDAARVLAPFPLTLPTHGLSLWRLYMHVLLRSSDVTERSRPGLSSFSTGCYLKICSCCCMRIDVFKKSQSSRMPTPPTPTLTLSALWQPTRHTLSQWGSWLFSHCTGVWSFMNVNRFRVSHSCTPITHLLGLCR